MKGVARNMDHVDDFSAVYTTVKIITGRTRNSRTFSAVYTTVKVFHFNHPLSWFFSAVYTTVKGIIIARHTAWPFLSGLYNREVGEHVLARGFDFLSGLYNREGAITLDHPALNFSAVYTTVKLLCIPFQHRTDFSAVYTTVKFSPSPS